MLSVILNVGAFIVHRPSGVLSVLLKPLTAYPVLSLMDVNTSGFSFYHFDLLRTVDVTLLGTVFRTFCCEIAGFIAKPL